MAEAICIEEHVSGCYDSATVLPTLSSHPFTWENFAWHEVSMCMSCYNDWNMADLGTEAADWISHCSLTLFILWSCTSHAWSTTSNAQSITRKKLVHISCPVSQSRQAHSGDVPCSNEEHVLINMSKITAARWMNSNIGQKSQTYYPVSSPPFNQVQMTPSARWHVWRLTLLPWEVWLSRLLNSYVSGLRLRMMQLIGTQNLLSPTCLDVIFLTFIWEIKQYEKRLT